MKINNKGFTFVEILAVIVIIGLLTGISIAAFSRYKENAIKSDYEALARASYNAMEEYMMSHPYNNKVSLETLEKENLLSNRKDPGSKDTDCTGTVEVSKNSGSNGKLDDGTYKVNLCCVSIQKTYTYPGGKETDLSDTSNCEYVPEDEPDEPSTPPTPPTPGTTYTLHYNDNNGSGCSSKSITKNAGEAWGSLCTPKRTGYTFVDWNYGTETITSSSIADGDITVKAEWKSTATTKYTLKYNDNGGSGCSSKTITKKKNEAWGTLCTPTKEGNTFGGWYDDSTKYTSSTKATKNVTVKAQWTPKKYTITVKKDGNINILKMDGTSTTSKTVNYGTTVKIETGAKDYYHVKWEDNNSTSTSRSIKVTGNTTLTVKSVKNQLTISMYSNGGKLSPGNQQLCRTQAGCGKNECMDNPEINKPNEVAKCRNGSGLIYVGTPDNFDSTVYNTSGLRNYKNKTTATLYMTRSGCTATGYWHVGSATSSVKINENTKYANTKAFVQACGSSYDKNYKKQDIKIDLYAGWNCPSSITCSAGKYLPKNKTSCESCTVGNYCSGGIFFKSTTTNQGIKACPTGYKNSPTGSSNINQCFIKISAGYYLGTAKGTTATKCPANTYRVAHNVNYNSTSKCGNCPSSYPKSAAGSTEASKCFRTNTVTFTYLKGAETWNGSSTASINRTCNQYYGVANCQVTAPNHKDIPGQSHCNKKYNSLIINKGWNKTKNSATGGIGTGKKINTTGNVTYYSVYLPNSNYINKNTALKVDGADNSHLSVGGTSDGVTCGKGSPNVYNRSQPKEDGFNTLHSYTLENAYIYWSGTWLVNTENKPYDENYLYIAGKPINSKGNNAKADKVCKQWRSEKDHYNEFANCPSSAYIKAKQLTW